MGRVPTQEVSLQSQRDIPQPGKYRHFKGGEYEVLKVACHSETKELLVVYCSVDDPMMTWVRPVEMFSGVVEGPGGPFPRFELMDLSRQRSGGLVSGLKRRAHAGQGCPAQSRPLSPT